HSLFTTPAWAAGEVLEFAGNFNKYITSRGLQKQEGVIFRHLLRLILLLKEFQQFTPPDDKAVTGGRGDSSFPSSSLVTHDPEAPASSPPPPLSLSPPPASPWPTQLPEISPPPPDCCRRLQH